MIDEHRKQTTRGEHLTLVDEAHGNKESESPSALSSNQGNQEDKIHNDYLQRAIKHCVELLAPQQRDAFLLRHEAGFSSSQVCEIVEAKPETVKTRLRYAMSQLRDCLQRKVDSLETGGERQA